MTLASFPSGTPAFGEAGAGVLWVYILQRNDDEH